MTKKHAATLLVLMMVALTGLANAQLSTMIKAQVPFDFIVNGKTMPAGECIVTFLVNGRTIVSIRDGEHHTIALPQMDGSLNASKETALVFHRYGNRYFLVRIKREGRMGYQLPASKLEAELQASNVDHEAFTLLASSK